MRLELGDAFDLLAELDADSVDAVVTDPPYGIRFMGEAWDGAEIERAAADRTRAMSGELRLTGSPDSPTRKLIPRTGSGFQNRAGEAGAYDLSLTGNRAFQAWVERWAAECLRVLKPGGHLLAFGGPRTYHRLAAGVEDAGFEVRDSIAWLYGSGFPKSLDVAKAIDRHAGVEREVLGTYQRGLAMHPGNEGVDNWREHYTGEVAITEPATDAASEWAGWGTALKPAFEPIVIARKPLAGTVAANVLEHGTGALNLDACRVGVEFADAADEAEAKLKNRHADYLSKPVERSVFGQDARPRSALGNYDAVGRWPANVILDPDAAEQLDAQTGELAAGNHPASRSPRPAEKVYGSGWSSGTEGDRRGTEAGGASRFFYCAKTSRAEREAGCEQIGGNAHPTVKPIGVMRWLVRLVTPPGGVVLDPFVGSGTTLIACELERFVGVGFEREAVYHAIASSRLAFWREHGEDGLRICAERSRGERVRRELVEAGQTSLFDLEPIGGSVPSNGDRAADDPSDTVSTAERPRDVAT